MTVDMEARKREAAEAAIEAEVRSGMALGLGTGSTARWLLEGLAERLMDGRLQDLIGVATSEQTAARGAELGIPVEDLLRFVEAQSANLVAAPAPQTESAGEGRPSAGASG